MKQGSPKGKTVVYVIRYLGDDSGDQLRYYSGEWSTPLEIFRNGLCREHSGDFSYPHPLVYTLTPPVITGRAKKPCLCCPTVLMGEMCSVWLKPAQSNVVSSGDIQWDSAVVVRALSLEWRNVRSEGQVAFGAADHNARWELLLPL